MAIHRIMVALVFILALANIVYSTDQVLIKGSVSCLDCHKGYDLSGIRIALKCKEAKKLTITYTNKDGTFETALPTDISALTVSSNCLASVLGGPGQLCSKRKNMVMKVVKARGSETSYTVSNPLSFYTSCPQSQGKWGATNPGAFEFESSKTFGFPPLGEWGLSPAAPYIPFFPIIGIP